VHTSFSIGAEVAFIDPGVSHISTLLAGMRGNIEPTGSERRWPTTQNSVCGAVERGRARQASALSVR